MSQYFMILFQFHLGSTMFGEPKNVRSRHDLLKTLTRPFLGFVLNPK